MCGPKVGKILMAPQKLGIKKGVTLDSNLVNLKSNTMKNTVQI